MKSIKVANGPELFSIKDGKLYVRTYSYDYVFRFNEARNVTSTSSSASQSQTTPPPKTKANSTGAEIKDYIEEDDETLGEEPIPYQLVETKPTFLGGDANQFAQWVNSKLQYPEEAKENGVQGRVVLQFTVQKDGSLANVKVLRGAHALLDKEAIRVVSMSPKWQPGTQRGKVVPVTYTFPVIFQLR